MYIGMNNYSLYNPLYCDGRFCCRDCDKCPIANEIMEAEEEDADPLISVQRDRGT